MTVVLKIMTKENQLIEFPILGKCTIGRSKSADLVIQDELMSSIHGTFEFNRKGQLIFSDNGSSNGSFLNDEQIQNAQFRVYENLKLGNCLITIDVKKLTERELESIGAKPIIKKEMAPEVAPEKINNKIKFFPKERLPILKNKNFKKEHAKKSNTKLPYGYESNVIELEKTATGLKPLRILAS